MPTRFKAFGSTVCRAAWRAPLREAFTALRVAVVIGAVVGCTPALDWREFVPEGVGLHVRFPCRPDRAERQLALAGTALPVTMLSCSADGRTFALGMAVVADPAQVTAVLRAWRESAGRRFDGARVVAVPGSVPGATANPAAGGVEIEARAPDGHAVSERLLFFVRDRRVFQAAVIGEATDGAVVETFLGGLRAAD